MAPPKKPASQLSKSARNFRKNPKSRAVKDALSKKVNQRPDQKAKRRELERKAEAFKKKHGVRPASKGLQFDHAVGKFVKAKTNLGRKGEGGRKKKS